MLQSSDHNSKYLEPTILNMHLQASDNRHLLHLLSQNSKINAVFSVSCSISCLGQTDLSLFSKSYLRKRISQSSWLDQSGVNLKSCRHYSDQWYMVSIFQVTLQIHLLIKFLLHHNFYWPRGIFLWSPCLQLSVNLEIVCYFSWTK